MKRVDDFIFNRLLHMYSTHDIYPDWHEIINGSIMNSDIWFNPYGINNIV